MTQRKPAFVRFKCRSRKHFITATDPDAGVRVYYKGLVRELGEQLGELIDARGWIAREQNSNQWTKWIGKALSSQGPSQLCDLSAIPFASIG